MTSPIPGVSLIIPARNSAATLRECLDSVRALDYPADLLQVIVVDNGSTDATSDIARRSGFPPLSCPKPGASAARNAGISASRHEIVAFLDSDAVAAPDWLRRLVEPFDDPAVGVVGGRIDPYRVQSGAEFHAVATHILDQGRQVAGSLPFMPPFVATANAAFRAQIVRRVGGFDESLAICEDADLSWRVVWEGCRIVYQDAARVRHHHRADRKSYLRQVRQYGGGSARLFAKHRRRLGRGVWISWRHHAYTALALVRIPCALIFARSRWGRVAPLYDFAAAVCWTHGRLRESIRSRVIAL